MNDDAADRPTTQASSTAPIAKRARDFDVVIATDFGHGADRAAPRSTTLTRYGAVPRRQCADQQRQSRLQPRQQVSARRLCLHRRARGAARDRRPSSATWPTTSPRTCAAHGRLRQDHHHPRQARLRHLRATAARARTSRPSPRRSSTRSAPAMRSSPSPRRWSRAGGSMNQVGFIGNVVGALKVEIVGHRNSVEKVPAHQGHHRDPQIRTTNVLLARLNSYFDTLGRLAAGDRVHRTRPAAHHAVRTPMTAATHLAIRTHAQGNKLMFIGNGGSAGDRQPPGDRLHQERQPAHARLQRRRDR